MVNLRSEKKGSRELLFDDEGRHVATIVEQGLRQFQWIVRGGIGHSSSRSEALGQIELLLGAPDGPREGRPGQGVGRGIQGRLPFVGDG